MTDASRRPGGSSRGLWILILVLLTPAVVLPLWVGLYSRATPTLFGFPFYYWFQFALILVAVALTVPAYVIARGVDRVDRVRHGLPPTPDGTGTDRKAGDPR